MMPTAQQHSKMARTNDQVKLADVAKEGVECLDVVVDDLENKQLVIILVDAENKVQACVAPEDELEVVGPLDKVAQARRARRDGAGHVPQHAHALLCREHVEVLCQAHLALSVAQNHRLDLFEPRTTTQQACFVCLFGWLRRPSVTHHFSSALGSSFLLSSSSQRFCCLLRPC